MFFRSASFLYSLLPWRGRACPALHLSASARLWDTCGPGMPGPYRSAGGYSTAPPLYTTVTSVSQSPVTAYLPLPAGIK